MSERQLAESIKQKNILDMALTFTAMMRVLAAGSKERIADRLYELTAELDKITTAEEYEHTHRSWCEQLCGQISTAEKQLKNKKIKPSQAISFGQTAKVLDIVLKVYVHYCAQPSLEVTDRLRPWLHGAVDTPIMSYLKKSYPDAKIKAATIEQVDEHTYSTLQRLIARDIQESSGGKVLPVEYDDILWHRFSRENKRTPNSSSSGRAEARRST